MLHPEDGMWDRDRDALQPYHHHSPLRIDHDPDIASGTAGLTTMTNGCNRTCQGAVLRDSICDKSDHKGSVVLYNARVRLKTASRPRSNSEGFAAECRECALSHKMGRAFLLSPLGSRYLIAKRFFRIIRLITDSMHIASQRAGVDASPVFGMSSTTCSTAASVVTSTPCASVTTHRYW